MPVAPSDPRDQQGFVDLPASCGTGPGNCLELESLHLARAHNLSVYDASYLELAVRRGLPLATLDDKLKAAARAVGVAEYAPSPGDSG
jgi:hypothetical protein